MLDQALLAGEQEIPGYSAVVTPQPTTRRERRLSGEAFGLAGTTTASVTAPETSPGERQTAAEVLAAAVLSSQPGTLTRRELRAATRREAGLDEAPSAVPMSVTSENETAPAPAEQAVDLEFAFAAVALTLSSLSVAPAPAVVTPALPAAAPTSPKAGNAIAQRAADPAATARAADLRAEVAGEATTARQWVPRLAVLSALGVATVVTPIHAMAQGSAEPEVVEAPLADSSALDTLVATPETVLAATETATGASDSEGTGIDETGALLAADPMADTRSVVAASRSEGRSELPQCGEPEAAQPNGSLAALESNEHLTLSMPVQEGKYRVSSGFGARWGSMHRATDFAAPVGTPIRAVASGEVTHAGGGLAGRSPNLIAIKSEIDGETVEIWYNHMFDDGVFVAEGDIVNVGDIIGEVGNNGNSTGPHLHLEVHVGNIDDPNGSAVDPLAWLRANSATPVTTSGAVCA